MNVFSSQVNKIFLMLLSLSLLSACGGSDNDSDTETPISIAATPTTAAVPSNTPTPVASVTPTTVPIPTSSPIPVATPLSESITVQAEAATLLSDPMIDRAGLPEVQVIGDMVAWIVTDQDGVEFNAPINAQSLTIGYISGTGGTHTIFIDDVLVGEFEYPQNSTNWQTTFTNAPTEISINLPTTVFEGSLVRVMFKDSESGSANIDYLTFNPDNVMLDTSTPSPEPTPADSISAKYMPQDNVVLVFAGQDNETVGGNSRFNDGYVENIGIPSGITHYVGIRPGLAVGGLNMEADWRAGSMHLKAYVDSSTLDGTIMHLAIDMVGAEAAIAAGNADDAIQELADFLNTYSDTPFLIRIGYEFDGAHNAYDPEPFKAAWKRIVNMLDDEGVTNFATMLHAVTNNTTATIWNLYYPATDNNRDSYVDWLGFSYFAGPLNNDDNALRFARQVGKPLCICESSPVNFDVETQTAEVIWNGWFAPYFEYVEANTDVIKAVAYINLDWPSQGLWQTGFFSTTDATLQKSPNLLENWLDKMNENTYIHTNQGVYDLINFVPQ